MILLLNRKWFGKTSIIGELFVDYEFECYTLEDIMRAVKVAGETAIPEGEYKINLDYSNRFKQTMPHLLDVPNFTGIRIHYGNTSLDTEGCILVGEERGDEIVLKSRKAFDKLMNKMILANTLNEEILIFIQKEVEE